LATTKRYHAYSPLVKELGEAERKESGGENVKNKSSPPWWSWILAKVISVLSIAISLWK